MGKSLRPRRLRERVLLPFVLVMVSAFTILEVMLIQAYDLSFTQSSEEKSVRLLAKVTAIMQQYGQTAEGLNELAADSMRLIKDISAVEIVFLDSERRLLFPEETQAINAFFQEPFLEQMKTGPRSMTPERIYKNPLNGRIYFHYLLPLSIAGTDVAFVCTGRYMAVYTELSGRITRVTVVLMLGFIVVMALIAQLISRKIVEPLLELERFAIAASWKEDYEYRPSSSVAEIRHLGKCIQDMVNDARRSETQQKAFFENVSHELRTPIMALQGYASGLSDGVFEDERAALEVIKRESDRLSVLVERIMLLARIDNKVFVQHRQPVNLNDLLYEIRDALFPALRERGLAMGISCPAGLSLTADRELLSEILRNPLANALRYARSRISVRAEMPDPELITIVIRDDGEGFPEEIIPHIFDRFHKGAAGRVGLGMAIASAAAELLGGVIDAGNQGGAVVRIELAPDGFLPD
ncbi:MAG: HAMP domain-containing histidine kinase [Gracilibacteraceae bacterium]|jgi:signal transduction histidine kinase|nr:HAMP domain-containing histidine kinase [Gracilibacteraceae bacterium]